MQDTHSVSDEMQIKLFAADVRVTEIRSPFPLFILDWLNNSEELVGMEIKLSDFYHEGRFASVEADFIFANMEEFLAWYEGAKTQEVVAVLREMTKQKRIDIDISTTKTRKVENEKVLDLPSIQESENDTLPEPAMVKIPTPRESEVAQGAEPVIKINPRFF